MIKFTVVAAEEYENTYLGLLEWPEDAGVHSFLPFWIEAQKLKTGSESVTFSFHLSVSCQDLPLARPNWNLADNKN